VGQFSYIDLANIPALMECGRQATEEMMPRILYDLNLEGHGAG
jgi:hypothetical protein